METDQLKDVVERKHGGSAQFARSVPVRETFEGKAVWEGMVHVFDLAGHPTATRAYAWSSPIEGSTKRVPRSSEADSRALSTRSPRRRGRGSIVGSRDRAPDLSRTIHASCLR